MVVVEIALFGCIGRATPHAIVIVIAIRDTAIYAI